MCCEFPSRFTVSNRTDKDVGNIQYLQFNNEMPLYFLNIRHPDNYLVLDEEGAEFKDYDAAHQEAVHSIRDIAADAVRRGGRVTGLSIEIADGSGKVLESIHARATFD
jgi:hypothetical protein